MALGDSIAFGVGATNLDGYTMLFRDYLQTTVHGSDKIEMEAWPGDDTTDLLTKLRTDQQLRQSLKRATVATISIGGNNLLRCLQAGAIDPACVAGGLATFAQDWPAVLSEIRESIGSEAQLYVMTVYNPMPDALPVYAQVEGVLAVLNGGLANPALMNAYQYKVADVHTVFLGNLPGGVPKVCVLTHMCDAQPDVHPSDAGHAAIAELHAPLYGSN